MSTSNLNQRSSKQRGTQKTPRGTTRAPHKNTSNPGGWAQAPRNECAGAPLLRHSRVPEPQTRTLSNGGQKQKEGATQQSSTQHRRGSQPAATKNFFDGWGEGGRFAEVYSKKRRRGSKEKGAAPPHRGEGRPLLRQHFLWIWLFSIGFMFLRALMKSKKPPADR